MCTYHRLVFDEDLVVFGNGNQEDDRRDVFKAVDPFFTLGPLTTHIKHAVCQLANDKRRLSNTSGLYTWPEHILIGWHIAWVANALDRVEIASIFLKVSPTSYDW